MDEIIKALQEYVKQKPAVCGQSVLEMLFEYHSERQTYDDEQIRADFHLLYQQMNGMPLKEVDKVIYPVCALCRDHERSGFMSEENYKYGLSKEAYTKAMAAMDKAWKPRDENGNILSEEELRARDYRAYYPVTTPTASGPVNPMTGVEEFANGKQPEGFHYEPGRLVSGCMYNGIALGPVIYDNPIYNMEIEKYRQFMKVKQYLDEQEERIRKKQEQETSKEKPAETTPEQPSLGVQVFRGNTPVSPVIREARSPEMIMGDPQVYESDQGMYIKLPEGDFSIANFTIRVPESRRVYTRPNEYHEEYSVDVTHWGYTQRLIIPKGSVSMVLKTIQKEVPACTVLSGIKSGSKLIENVIRMQTMAAEKVDVINCEEFVPVTMAM